MLPQLSIDLHMRGKPFFIPHFQSMCVFRSEMSLL